MITRSYWLDGTTTLHNLRPGEDVIVRDGRVAALRVGWLSPAWSGPADSEAWGFASFEGADVDRIHVRLVECDPAFTANDAANPYSPVYRAVRNVLKE